MILAFLLVSWPTQGAAAGRPKLVLLTETGQSRDGLPILKIHPDPGAGPAVLTGGFSGRLLQLYQWQQEYLRRLNGSGVEPAYLLLSGNQGGFPRFGFYLGEEDKTHAAYVDLHRSKPLKGRFGGMDQIFPHELAHIILRSLSDPVQGGSNQMHAIGVRTDPQQAFQEGFAEHFQVMAIEDPDAAPETRALVNSDLKEMSEEQAARYRRELQRRWPLPGPLRMGFIVWFSGTEQVWRYFSVKDNVFAHLPELPDDMLLPGSLQSAYLMQNTVPASLQDPVKAVSMILSTEGAVSSFFYMWANSVELQRHYRDDDFYLRFGITSADVSPLENCYLKLFHAIFVRKPSETSGVINAYREVFPDEAPFVDAIVHKWLAGRRLPATPAFLLANRDFRIGTSLFDQFRSIPRTHTFDLNAATLVDLLGVPGVTRDLAERILNNAPYSDLSDLKRLPGFTSTLWDRFSLMTHEMDRIASGSAEDEAVLSLGTIIWSYVWRALAMLAVAAVMGATLYRRIYSARKLRAALNGFSASFLVMALAWMTTGTAAYVAFLGPMILFAVPAALWQMGRLRRFDRAGRLLAAWAGAAIPAVAIAYPWF